MLHHTLAENKNFLLPLDHDRLNKIQTASGRGGILGGGGVLGAVPYSFFFFGRGGVLGGDGALGSEPHVFAGVWGVGLDWILLYGGRVHVCGSGAGKSRVL